MPLNIMSLGAGVQSSTLALMAEAGEITPRPDAAIFSDTLAEPNDVYEWLAWLERKLSFPLHRVSAGSLRDESLAVRKSGRTGQMYVRTLIPAFVKKPNGSKALMGRKCTAEFKVREIIKQCRVIVGKTALNAWRAKHRDALKRMSDAIKHDMPIPMDAWRECQDDALVHQWIGISLDEMKRAKESRDPWIKTVFPLIQRRMTRSHCLEWMEKNGHPRPPRSACGFCPFHSDSEWLRQKISDPDEFKKSVEFERQLNAAQDQATGTARLQGPIFLHSSLIPLDQVEFKDSQEDPRSSFGGECEGLCGV